MMQSQVRRRKNHYDKAQLSVVVNEKETENNTYPLELSNW